MTLLLVAVSTSCLLAIWVLALSEDESRADLDLPRKERVSGWPEAAKLARINTFEPTYLPQGVGEPELTVRGIPGDSSRPFAAEYRGSLVLRQAHVDIAPGLEDEPAEVSGADEAWWGTVQETTYLYVRRGATLIILSGHSRDELIRVAGSLRPVDDGKLAHRRVIARSGAPAEPARARSVRSRLPAVTRSVAYTNPVIRWDFADPSVLKARDGFYYAYSTEHLTLERLAYIQVARSKDLVNWELLPDAMPAKPEWASTARDFWAPGVIEADGRYYMYFSGIPDEGEGMCLGVATSGAPEGPFLPEDEPLRCGEGFENIDPMPFDDPQTGKSLLYWGSDGSPIFVQELAPDRKSFGPGSSPKELIFPGGLQHYERLIEGAFVVYRDGYYYLFYSGDNCCVAPVSYAVMVARSRSAAGPFEKRAEVTGEIGGSVILHMNERWQGPGHNSVIRDEAGQDWIVYHAIDPHDRYNPGTESPKRPMLIDPIAYRDGWPQIEKQSPSTAERQGPLVD